MSTIAATNLKNASSGSNNIVLNTDGTTTVPTLSSTTITGTTIQGTIKSGTAVASTSGTAIDFTGLPSWVKRVTVMFDGVSTSGVSSLLIQIGDSEGIENTGYACGGANIFGTNLTGVSNSTAGFVINAGTATHLRHGHMVITSISTTKWVSSHSMAVSDSSGGGQVGGGTKTLSATLDRIRITTVNGTDTFDAGSINILYEG
jgi:hypothetical protein